MRSANPRRNPEYDRLHENAEWMYVSLPKREHAPSNLFWTGVLLLAISAFGLLFWLEAMK